VAIVTGDDLQVYDPALGQADADRLAGVATDAVEAFLEPRPVPDPVPKRMRMVAIAFALRFNRATPNTAGAVVSESLGSYSYRLDRPMPLDAALKLPDELASELLPWAPHRGKVYTVDVELDAGRPSWWPADWWQRDLDTLDDPVDAVEGLPA
jgi:hypothetical protein